MAAHLSITCPICRESFPVPAEVLEDTGGTCVDVRLDRTELYGHLGACAERAGEKAAAELEARAAHPSAGVHPVPIGAGDRPCTSCGHTAPSCLDQLQARAGTCCEACAAGNTHLAEREAVGCAAWAERGQD